MDFKVAVHSDIGIKKNINQDALLVKVAQTRLGKVCLCVICDGVGGLSEGEMASAAVVLAFERWFEKEFSEMIHREFNPDELKIQWTVIVQEQNLRLSAYAACHGMKMGTTLTVLLIIENTYYIMNIGDSRVYLLDEEIHLLTKDQTFIQYALNQGHISAEEARIHPKRHMLLQCVGASEAVKPDFYNGGVCVDCVFVLCSDGFRNAITPEEIYDRLNPLLLSDENVMKDNAVQLTELNKERFETDNISVIVIRACQGA